jgi:hypothetical protein
MAQKKAVVLQWRSHSKGSMNEIHHGLQRLGWQSTQVYREPNRQTSCEIKRIKPDLVVAFQRLYVDQEPERLMAEAVAQVEARTLFADFAPVTMPGEHYGGVIVDALADKAAAEIAGGNLDAWLEDATWGPLAHELSGRVGLIAARISELAVTAEPIDAVPEALSFFPLQRTNDMNLQKDSRWPDPAALAFEFCRAVKANGLTVFPVFKPHPHDGRFGAGVSGRKDSWTLRVPGRPDPISLKRRGSYYRMLERRGKSDPQNEPLNCWLMARCERMFTVCSTVLYQALALGKPVTTLGRGWFTGNGVTHEAAGRPLADALAEPDAVDPERVRLFLGLLLARQRTEKELSDPAVVERLLADFYGPEFARSDESERTSSNAPAPADSVSARAEPIKAARGAESALAGDSGAAAVAPDPLAFVWLAMGERHWPLAMQSIRSVREHEGDVRCIVITNRDWADAQPEAESLGFEVVPVDWPSIENRYVKTLLPEYLPPGVERVVYLDADTVLTRPILAELLPHLDRYELVCCQDPFCLTVGRRRERKSPQLTRRGIAELYELAGPGATMPQFGFLAFRVCPAVRDFYRGWNEKWQALSAGAETMRERGDSDAGAMALMESAVRHEILPPEYWHHGEKSQAAIRHSWGRHSRQPTIDPPTAPIITTVYVPDAGRERYKDTGALVARCMLRGLRGHRYVCPDKAPPELVEWFRHQGHTVVEPDTSRPLPRMTINMGRAAALIDPRAEFIWTIEQDVIVSKEAADEARAMLAAMPEDVACLLLLSVDERGKRVKPYRPHPAWERPFPDYEGPGTATLQDRTAWYATLWRGEAWRRIDWPALPPFHSSDKIASKQLGAAGYRFAGAPGIEAVHFPRSSHGGKDGGPL